jgi:hypothetical protein
VIRKSSLADAVRVTWPLTGLLTATLETTGAVVSGAEPPPPQEANTDVIARVIKNFIFNTLNVKKLKY